MLITLLIMSQIQLTYAPIESSFNALSKIFWAQLKVGLKLVIGQFDELAP